MSDKQRIRKQFFKSLCHRGQTTLNYFSFSLIFNTNPIQMKSIKNIFLLLISLLILQQSFAQTNTPPTGVQSIILNNNDSEEYLTKKDFQLYTKNIRKGGKFIAVGGGLIMSSAIMYAIGFTGLGNSHRSAAPVVLVALGTFSTCTGFALITAGGVRISKDPLMKNRKESAKLNYQLGPTRAGLALSF